MNKREKEVAALFKKREKEGWPLHVKEPPEGMKFGDRLTIKGRQCLPDGSVTAYCALGQETVFVLTRGEE